MQGDGFSIRSCLLCSLRAFKDGWVDACFAWDDVTFAHVTNFDEERNIAKLSRWSPQREQRGEKEHREVDGHCGVGSENGTELDENLQFAEEQCSASNKHGQRTAENRGTDTSDCLTQTSVSRVLWRRFDVSFGDVEHVKVCKTDKNRS